MKNMMRKITAVMAGALLLTGCSAGKNKTVEKVTITNPLKLETKTLDMSGYQYLDDSDPAFIQISMEESLKMYEEGGTGVILYSYDTCPWCNRAVPVLDEAAKEMGVKIYYVNVYEPEIISDENKTKGAEIVKRLETDIDSVLEHQKDEKTGEEVPQLYLPLVIAVKDGKIVDHHTSLVSDFKLNSDASNQMTDSEKEELKEDYEKMIQEVAD